MNKRQIFFNNRKKWYLYTKMYININTYSGLAVTFVTLVTLMCSWVSRVSHCQQHKFLRGVIFSWRRKHLGHLWCGWRSTDVVTHGHPQQHTHTTSSMHCTWQTDR